MNSKEFKNISKNPKDPVDKQSIDSGTPLLDEVIQFYLKNMDEEICSTQEKDMFNLVSQYLAEGGDPNIKSTHGWTALMGAAQRGHLTIVDLLLRHNADPNIQMLSSPCVPLAQ